MTLVSYRYMENQLVAILLTGGQAHDRRAPYPKSEAIEVYAWNDNSSKKHMLRRLSAAVTLKGSR